MFQYDVILPGLSFCPKGPESVTHLLNHCYVPVDLWDRGCCWPTFLRLLLLLKAFEAMGGVATLKRKLGKSGLGTFHATVWSLWLQTNNMMFLHKRKVLDRNSSERPYGT